MALFRKQTEQANNEFIKAITSLHYIIGSCFQKEQLNVVSESIHRLIDPYAKIIGKDQVVKAKNELFIEIDKLNSTYNYD